MNATAYQIRFLIIFGVFLNLFSALFMAGMAAAAVMPAYEHLAPLTNTISGPVAMALDGQGRLYVAETDPGRMVVLSQGGKHLLSTLSGLDSPIAVAVDDSGRIYVASKNRGSVEVYGTDLPFHLGSGDGEFSRPSDICIDAGGRIYVVDRGRDMVMMYDSSGRFLDSIGSSGNGAGQFHRPVAMTIDEAAGEIIVLDRQLVAGTAQMGARIQYFTLEGAYVRGFSRDGTQVGGMVRPQGITVDKESRIYVTDSYQNAVLVYDNSGIFLGVIYDLADPMRIPLGVAVDGANRLYVASRMANRIEVYGIDQYTGMEVDPIRLNFIAKEGAASPASQSISVSNSGNTTVSWGAAANENWLSLSADSGVLAQGQAAAIDVAVNITSLEPGKHFATVTVSAGPGITEVVQVALTIAPSAFLSLSPANLTFTSEIGTHPDVETVTIANSGSAPLQWSLSADQEWLSLSKTAGTVGVGEPGSDVAVLADITSLAAGTYTGIITVTGLEAIGSPSVVEVTLNLSNKVEDPEDDPPRTPPPGTTLKGNFGRTWRVAAQVDGISLNSIWGSSDADIFAVGDSGTILHFDGEKWNEEHSATTTNLNGVGGASTAMVYAVGDNGLILQYDGVSWTSAAPVSANLHDVWCSSGDRCLAVGQDTSILFRTGAGSWTADTTMGSIGSLHGVWGSGESDIYAVGDLGAILHYDGSRWENIESGTDTTFYDVWGSSADKVYVVGQNGTILHYNGTEWSTMASGTTVALTGIWGNAANDLYAVGEDGTVLHYQGARWNKLETGFPVDLNDAWGCRKGEIYAVSSDGSIIYGRKSFPWFMLRPVLLHTQSRPGVEKTDSVQIKERKFLD